MTSQPNSDPGSHPLGRVLNLAAPDMAKVDQHIHDCLSSDVVLINQVANYIVSGGGKRLRPMLHIISARACGYQGSGHINLAAIIEFIHTATLLHDDVVDESEIRRGKESAHAVWGNAASVLVGDFLYSRSFQMMVKVDLMPVMKIMADATNTIAEGEVLQLLNMGDPAITEANYFKVIEDKTAKLFEAGCRLGPVLAGESAEVETELARFGKHLGIAFQVTDDVLDYSGDDIALGKNTGDDLAEGKPTLPLIHARAAAQHADREIIDEAVKTGGHDALEAVLSIIRSTGALESAMAVATQQAEQATACLQILKPSPWREALAELARYSCNRDH